MQRLIASPCPFLNVPSRKLGLLWATMGRLLAQQKRFHPRAKRRRFTGCGIARSHGLRFELVSARICIPRRFSDFGAGIFVIVFGRRELRHFNPRRVGPKWGTDLRTFPTGPNRRLVA
jgi:hypothetical protein